MRGISSSDAFFESGLKHDLVEGLLLYHLAVLLGLEYHYRSAGSSVSLVLGSLTFVEAAFALPRHGCLPLDGPLLPLIS